jgi:regulation of enolase protein 1 (concanavalin A-like superfamily)
MFKNFKWENQTEVLINDKSLVIKAAPSSNYFIDPSEGTADLSGQYFYLTCEDDFTLRAKVTPNFTTVYDACALLAKSGDKCWAKLCFEYTDIGTYAVVSVVTDGVSDDANGVNIAGNSIYLQLAKKGDVFAMHYSENGKDYQMVRYFSLPHSETWQLGFVAQSPMGSGGERKFEEIELYHQAPDNLRKGWFNG